MANNNFVLLYFPGGGHSIDVIDSGSGSDFASGDCVRILFDGSDYHLRNVTSTSIDVGGMDELRMGEGEIIVKKTFNSHFLSICITLAC